MPNLPQKDRAAQFRALHAPGRLALLPNSWDAASARIAEESGAKAIATSSAAVAWAFGYADGEKLPKERLVALVRDIVRVVNIPLSADSEMGFSSSPSEVADFVVALAREGAVGINLEDGHGAPELLAAKIKEIKTAVARAGFDVFVNARADVYLRSLVPADRALEETLARGRLYHDAGADGFFVPALTDTGIMRKIADAIDLPLNVLTRKDLPPVDALKEAGVRRISAGAGIARAAYDAARRAISEILDRGRYDAMLVDAEN